METPFDGLISYLWQSMMNILHRKAQPSELFLLVYNFSKIARVLYVNMSDASEKLQAFIDTQNKQWHPRTPTLEETHESEDGPIRCRLSYVQFIEQINRTGRVLKQKGFKLPSYGKVYFFRNKMVEHWDDYLQFLAEGDALSFSRVC